MMDLKKKITEFWKSSCEARDESDWNHGKPYYAGRADAFYSVLNLLKEEE